MKRKYILPILMFACVLMVTACGGKDRITEEDTMIEENETEEAELVKTEETASTEATEVSETEEEATTSSANDKNSSTEEAKSPTTEPTKPVHTHSWSKATCTSAASCSCGETNGGALGHDFGSNNQTCSRCGVTNPNYQSAHTHTFTGGDCSHPSSCSCGAVGSYGDHKIDVIISYTPGAKCGECGYTGTVNEVSSHQDESGCSGYCGDLIPVRSSSDVVVCRRGTCTICGAVVQYD